MAVDKEGESVSLFFMPRACLASATTENLTNMYRFFVRIFAAGGSPTSAAPLPVTFDDALNRLGPTIHHRSFFAPVVAARAKHMPWTVEPAQDLFEVTEVEVQMAVEIDASASL